MIDIRPFLPDDAKTIVSWIKDEREFRMWCADHYPKYPLNPEEIVRNYEEKAKKETYIPLMFEENNKAVGHLILRYPYPEIEPQMVRLGFIIVNNRKRNKDYGKRIILHAMQYAVVNLHATKFNLGVFRNNIPAHNCYEKVGFKTFYTKMDYLDFYGERWDWDEMIFNPATTIVNRVKEDIIKPILELKIS